MNDKKNIDRLFQEKFKDFEVTPPEFVWENIQSRLEEKKKRRIVPLWFKFSGVAALLVVGIFILGPYLGNNGDSDNSTVVTDTKETNADGTKRIEPTENPVRQGQSVSEQAVASGEESSGSSAKNSNSIAPTQQQQRQDAVRQLPKSNSFNNNNESVANNDRSGLKRNNTTERKTAIQQARTAVAQNEANRENKTKNSITGAIDGNDPQGVADNAIGEGGIDKKGTDGIVHTNDVVNKNGSPVAREQGIAVNTPVQDNDIQQNTAGSNEDNSIGNTIVIPQEIKVDEGIAGIETTIDTAAVTEPENELEKAYREKLLGKDKEEKAIAESSRKGKWNVKPQMAPLFFNTASEGSPIDTNLAANSKDFDNDLSYGVGVDYALTDRISIRSGINTVNMRYSTNDVEFYASLNNQPFSSVVNPTGANANLVVNPAGNAEATDNLRTQTFDGSLVQKIGFIEVPLEMSYKLVNRKFGIDLIGGVSTLFLNANNVSVVSEQGFNSDMGEARNINNVSFSTNVGVGFKYRIIQSLEASFEPMFKYQLNTFSNNSGNFKPYFIGLYSGISFSF